LDISHQPLVSSSGIPERMPCMSYGWSIARNPFQSQYRIKYIYNSGKDDRRITSYHLVKLNPDGSTGNDIAGRFRTYGQAKQELDRLHLAALQSDAKTRKRPRHVFPTGEIPHLWAHKVQPDARNADGNLYFGGDTIYSYGEH